MTINDYLKYYIDTLGWSVFPVKPDKTPYVKGGFKSATNDFNEAVKMFSNYSDALIGVATGAISGIEVLDIDVKKQEDGTPKLGEKVIEVLQNDYGSLPKTLAQRTPSGGLHLFFKRRENKPMKTKIDLLPGLDVRADGAYVVVASPQKAHYFGKDGNEIEGKYEWLNSINKPKLEFAPDWLIDLTQARDKSSAIEIPQLQSIIKQKYGKDVKVKDYGTYYSTNCYMHDDNHPSMLISKTTGLIRCLACGYESDVKKDFGIEITAIADEETVDAWKVLSEGRIDVRTAITTEPPDYDFVIPGLQSGDVGLIIAPGGTGKGFLGLGIAISVSNGIPICGGLWETATTPPKPGKVTVLFAEDSKVDITRRIYSIVNFYLSNNIELDIDLLEKNLCIVSLNGYNPKLINGNGEISRSGFYEAIIELASGSRLTILDPYSRFKAAFDENSNALATKAIQAIESIAKKTGSSILITHHASKFYSLNQNADSRDAGRGASALIDAVRFQINLTTMTEEEQKKLSKIPDTKISDRREFLKVSMTKVNYMKPKPEEWLQRNTGGVLIKFEPSSDKQKVSKPTKANERKELNI